MTAEFSPALVLILGALAIPLLPQGVVRNAYMVLLPIFGGIQVFGLEPGLFGLISVFDLQLVTLRVDSLSVIFGIIFNSGYNFDNSLFIHSSDRNGLHTLGDMGRFP